MQPVFLKRLLLRCKECSEIKTKENTLVYLLFLNNFILGEFHKHQEHT